MLFSREWLSQYIQEDLPSAETIAEKLGMHSFEVEGVHEKGGDSIIDIDVLPNRAHDCLSYIGMAREIALVCGLTLTLPEKGSDVGEGNISEMIALGAVDSDGVRRASKRIIQGVSVGPSPEWLVKRLNAMGQRSINNIVDITNYVMYEFGQPVHAFDYDKLSGDGALKSITIRRAHEGETITTLDGNEYTLDETMLVIADEEKALDIAGIKGGNISGIDESTTTIMLSVCSFDPYTIRKTSQKLALRTDASTRFEKDISPELVMEAMMRATLLIQKVAGGTASDVLDEYSAPTVPKPISLSVERSNRLLGTTLKNDEVEDILRRLDFVYEKTDSDYDFVITPPLYRLDISIEEDLIEEVGRVYGYYNIPEQEPYTGHGPVEINKEFYWINRIKDILVKNGYVEVFTYSFSDTGDIELQNALADDKRFLRNSLVPGITAAEGKTTRIQPRYGTEDISIFEIGKVFKANEGEVWEIMASHDIAPLLEKEIGIGPLEKTGDREFNLSAYIKDLDQPEGYDNLEVLSFSDVSYTPESVYPFVLRDIAVWVPENTTQHTLEKVIQENAGDLLVNMYSFDEFKKENRVSYGFRLVFQSHEKTLTDEEVNIHMDAVTKALNQHESFEVR